LSTTVSENIVSTKLNNGIGNYLYHICYYFISAVLIGSGLAKIIDPSGMLNTLDTAFNFLSEDIIVITATTIPIAELGIGVMLLLKIKTKLALTLTVTLFAGFFLFSIYGNIIGLNDDCGCFGNVIKSDFGWGMIVRNAFLMLLTIYLIIKDFNYPAQSGDK